MSIFKKLSIALSSSLYTDIHIEKLTLRAAVVANRSIASSSDIQGISPPLKLRVQFNMQCQCCKQNKLSLPYNFLLQEIGDGIGHPLATPLILSSLSWSI